MRINGNLVLNSDASGELQNAYIERLASAPTFNAAQKGRIYFNTTTALYYFNDGASWTPFSTGGSAAALQGEVDAIETSLGAGIASNGTFVSTAFDGSTYITSPTDFTDALLQLDAAINGNNTLAELDDVVLGTLNDNDLIQYDTTSGDWINVAIGSASGIQAYDAGLTALAAKSSTGIMVQTGADTYSSVSLTAPAAGLTITNADGVAGSPTFALANGLASIEALATTGFVVQSAADTFITRDIVTASSGRITVTNGDGVAGSPTVDLATVTNSNTGSFLKVTTDSYGRVTGTEAVVASDITGLVDSTYVNASGDTMTGNLNMGGFTVTGLAAPVNGTDAVNKNYADALSTGLTWKNAARAATTANIADFTAVTIIDGVTLADGDRVLVKNQTAPAENGIYVYTLATTTLARAADMNVAAEFAAASLFVTEGTANADTGWTQTAEVAVVGTDAVNFVQFTGSGSYTAGTGLQLSGNTFSVNLGAGIAELPTDEVGIDLFSATAGAIILSTDGTARSTATGAKLHLLLKAAGGLTQDVDGLYIPAGGVTNAMLTNSTITLDADDAGTATVALGATFAILGDATSGVSTAINGGGFKVSVGDATASQKGVASFNSAQFSVTAGAVSLDASIGDLNNVATAADSAAANDVLSFVGGEWTNVTRDAVVGSTSIDAHSDVTLTSAAAGETLVYDGAAFVNRKTYHLYTAGAASTSHTVTHNIGQKYCNVTVVDDTDNVVIPQSIVFDSNNQLTVTFTMALQCKVVVMGVA